MKQTYYVPLFIFLFFGCISAQKKTPALRGDEPFYSIIYLDTYYSEFLQAVKKDFAGKDRIYSDKIQKAVVNDHFLKAEYSDIVSENFAFPIQDTSGLLKSIADLEKNKALIEKKISSTLALCSKHIKNDSIKFYIIPSRADLKPIITPMGGVMGLTAGSKQIILTIDFSISSWEEMLAYTIAHEFNHAYWTNTSLNSSFRWTLLRYLVFEGKADSFAHQLFPKTKAPWTQALNETEEQQLLEKIKPLLQSENPSILTEVMFGSANYPVWGGYTLGYNIVQSSFKNHPELLKSSWTNLEAEKILELSGYK